jgi:ribosomal protein L13E
MEVAKPTVEKGYSARKHRFYSLQEIQEINLDPKVSRKKSMPADMWTQTKDPKNMEQTNLILKAIHVKHGEKPANQ